MVPVTFEAQHRVDHVFEGAGPRQRAVLGDVADQHGRHLASLGQADELVGALAHLPDRARHTAGPALTRRRRAHGHRLDGVDHHQVRLRLDHCVDHLAHVGGRQDQQARWHGAEAFGAQAHLVGGLLRRHQQDPVAGPGPGGQHLEQQGRLADARLAPEQGDRSRDQAPRQHPVEFLDPGGHRGRLRQVHGGEGHGESRQVEFVHGPHQWAQRRLLHQGVPLPAGRAPPGPAGGRGATVDAAVALGRLCHFPMVGTGCAIRCDPGRSMPEGARGPGTRHAPPGGPEGRCMPDPVSGDEPSGSGTRRTRPTRTGHHEPPATTSRTPVVSTPAGAKVPIPGRQRGTSPRNTGVPPPGSADGTDAPHGGTRYDRTPGRVDSAGGAASSSTPTPTPGRDAPRPRHGGGASAAHVALPGRPGRCLLSRRRTRLRRAPSAVARCPRWP